MGLGYYTSERFIHDDLVRLAEAGLKGVYQRWGKEQRIDPFVVTWPAEPVPDDSGQLVSDLCVLELPEDREKWNPLMLEAIRRTKAYGVLLVEQRKEDIRAILETRHGSRCWTVPIVRNGDVFTLKKPEVTSDRESLGFLWQRKVGQA